MKIDLCLPVYNEEKILANNVLKLLNYCQAQNFNFNWEIVIVINGSSDKSYQIAKELSKSYPLKIKTKNITEPGRGNALKTYWLQSSADIVSYMDADLAVSLDNISDLVTPLINNDCDCVIGSRLLPQSKIKRTFIREVFSRGCNLFYRIITGYKISDTQCGFKAIKKEVFKKISPYIKNKKWFFDTEIITYTLFRGYKLKEIPVEWEENRFNKRKSKVNLIKDSFLYFRNLLTLKYRMLKKYETNRHNSCL